MSILSAEAMDFAELDRRLNGCDIVSRHDMSSRSACCGLESFVHGYKASGLLLYIMYPATSTLRQYQQCFLPLRASTFFKSYSYSTATGWPFLQFRASLTLIITIHYILYTHFYYDNQRFKSTS